MPLLSSFVLCSLLLPAPALAPPGSQIVFSESYEKAFEEATERGVPLMICIIQDDEEANDDVWLNTINAPEFVEATQGTVNLLGNRGTQELHGYRQIEVDGRPRRLCGKFGSIACMDHKRAEVGIFRDFARDGRLQTPLVMLVLPDQTILATLIDRNPMPDYLDAFRKAKRQLPNGLSQEEVLQVRQGLKDSKVWLEQGEIGKVIQFASPLAKRDSVSTLLKRAGDLLRRVEQLGREELEGVEARLEKREYAPAITMLDDLIRRYKRSAIESVARERRAHLLKNRQVKAALTAAKRAKSARKLLENADSLAAKGQDARAAKLYERIRERFADTDAARELAGRPPADQP